jgi:hypothetical protein
VPDAEDEDEVCEDALLAPPWPLEADVEDEVPVCALEPLDPVLDEPDVVADAPEVLAWPFEVPRTGIGVGSGSPWITRTGVGVGSGSPWITKTGVGVGSGSLWSTETGADGGHDAEPVFVWLFDEEPPVDDVPDVEVFADEEPLPDGHAPELADDPELV